MGGLLFLNNKDMAEKKQLTNINIDGKVYGLGIATEDIYAELGISQERFVELLSRDFYCPTLTSAPTSSTLTYTDTDGSTNHFQIGQMCRWADGNDWRVAICKNATSTTVAWYVLPVKVSDLTNDSGFVTKSTADSSYLGKSAKAASATTADSATTATNLSSAPSLEKSGNNITVTAGGKTSSAFTVPYATSAGSASSATKATHDASGNVITSTYATKTALSGIQTQIDTLVSGDASSAIESFNEIVAFLEGVEDDSTLEGVIAGINTQISGKAAKGDSIKNITRSGNTFTATRADGTTFTFDQKDTTYSAATQSSAGLMSAADKTKLDGIQTGADAVSVSQKLTSGTEVGTITVNGVGTKLYAPTNTNTTYTFSGGTNKFTVTPSTGTAQEVAVTPSISNNVTYSGTLTSGAVAVYDGTAGKIKSSGYTIAKSVPSDAKFTDTTYSSKSAASGGTDVSLVTTGEKATWNAKASTSVATTSANGLMSKDDKTKLDGIATGATANKGTVTKITAGTGLTGGDITSSGTIALATSGVTAGTYGDDESTRTLTHSDVFDVPQITVDSYGRVTSATTKTLTLPASGNTDTYTSAYCNTAAGTAAKAATCTGYSLLANSYLHITMVNSNSSAGALTLNVNEKGAKPVYINGSASSSSNYNLPAGTYIVYYDGSNYYFRTDGAITGKTTSVPNHSADYIIGGYLNIHPENSPTLIPMINNDIAHLLKRGGSAVVTYDGTTKSVDLTNVFDGSPSYCLLNSTGITTIVIELTLHKTFAWSNTIYVDFGSTNWRAKSIKVEVMNSSYSGDVWTQKGNATNNGSGHYAIRASHKPVGATNEGGGFNKVRFTFGSWLSGDFRIAALGIYNYASSGLRETFVPRDGGNLYGSLAPSTNGSHSLGTTERYWGSAYINKINGVSVGSSPKFTDTTYSSKTAASGGTDVSLVTTGEKATWNAKASTAVATTSANGLMSKEDKTKLNGIAQGATANIGTITGIKMNGASKGSSGVVDLGTVITAHQDISGKLDKTTAASTYATKASLDGLQTQINTLVEGNAKSTIESFNEIVAFLEGVEDDSTLEGIIAGINTQISGKAAKGDSIKNITRSGNTFTATRADGTTFTFDQKDTTYSSKTAASGGTDVSLVTTGEKYTWNSKASTAVATTTANGLMSKDDKSKLNGIASGAEVNVQSDWNVTDTTSDAYIKNKPTIPSAVTSSTVSGWGFTKNAGTITGITMNGSSKGTSGVVDLGTVITSHQTVKQDGITGATANRFCTCSTDAGTAAKTASITSGTFNLEAGAKVSVKFSNANTASSPTLNVNSKGAKNIFHKGAQITSGTNKSLLAGVVEFIYDGTQWHLIGNYIDSNTTYSAGNGLTLSSNTFNIGAGTGVEVAADAISVKYGTSAGTAAQGNDSRLSDARNPKINSLSSEDLNNITTPGFYAGGGSNTVTNKPSGIDAFGLIVFRTAGGYITQELIEGNTNAGCRWTRQYTGSWGSWIPMPTFGATPTSGQVLVTDGTTGKVKSSGYTIAKSVPSDAKFTDTTYSSKSAASGGTEVSLVTTGEKATWNAKASTSVATTSANGLMSKDDKSKLNGIASGAEVNVQSDWNVTDTTSDAYIKNKPTIPTDYLGCENVGEELEEVVEYLTTSSQTLSDAEKERVKSNIGVNVPIVEHGTSDQTFALTSNKYHRWGAMTSLTLTLASPNDTSVVNNYAFEFTSGETPTTLLVPSNIQWVNDVNIEANMRYQGIINSGIGVLVSVSNE